ncbi:hypothetical protein V8G61_09735 [Gaetbulibacter sp. M240]|uniref:hypothetical protein n=1 Tax=Gaetbulibacter sp. M240 TaxID=3126511 RepID=UPI00374EEEE1
MKYLIWIFFIASMGSIIAGFSAPEENNETLIGLGVVGLFIIVFPLFTWYRWKDRDIKDYMLTKENLDKMRDNQKSNKKDKNK